jgi:DNA-directed RNA polymerase subunit RPC12/RpoP
VYIKTPSYGEFQVIPPVAGDAVMPRSTYFVQECPTCGRNLQVRIEYLGKQVVCQHCSAKFEACEPGSAAYPQSSGLSLLERADQLLQTAGASGAAPMTDVVPIRPR